MVADRPHDVDELDLGGESVAVEYQRPFGTVPAVELDGPVNRKNTGKVSCRYMKIEDRFPRD